jgi:hypothetical protein
VKKLLLLLAGATLFVAACSQAPTAPTGSRLAPRQKASLDEELTCRSGYVVAFDQEGNAYCKLDDSGMMSGGGDTTATGRPPL